MVDGNLNPDVASQERANSGSAPSGKSTAGQACRFCGSGLQDLVVDLGMSPLCETFLSADQLTRMEPFYPLQAYVCSECFLVQVAAHVSGETIFGGDYAYFSSYSNYWLRRSEEYVAEVCERFGLDNESTVIEVASNDGYLLQYFLQRGIRAIGIEPAGNVAAVAVEKGIPTIRKYLTEAAASELAGDGLKADLLIGNNVLAHVPDLNDFVRGLRVLLAPAGVLTMEFHHLANLIEKNQFDTIYQEHYCYLSLCVVSKVFAAHGLTVFDVEEVPTHGGSLRVFARHSENGRHAVMRSVGDLQQREIEQGLMSLDTYAAYGERVAETKRALLELLIDIRRDGKRIVGYGAPGKGNTLLNYCGIRQDFVEFVVDRNPYKHGRFLPGTHIPVYPPEKIAEDRPDYVLILPWNLKDEITDQLEYIREWGGKFIVPIPELQVI